mgnify:CR=1 FL=1
MNILQLLYTVSFFIPWVIVGVLLYQRKKTTNPKQKTEKADTGIPPDGSVGLSNILPSVRAKHISAQRSDCFGVDLNNLVIPSSEITKLKDCIPDSKERIWQEILDLKYQLAIAEENEEFEKCPALQDKIFLQIKKLAKYKGGISSLSQKK